MESIEDLLKMRRRVDLAVIRHGKGGTSIVGTCQSCGATFDEAEVL